MVLYLPSRYRVFQLHLVCICPLPPCPLLPSLMEWGPAFPRLLGYLGAHQGLGGRPGPACLAPCPARAEPGPLLPSRVGSRKMQGLLVTRLVLPWRLKDLPNMICVPLGSHLPAPCPGEAVPVPTASLRGPIKSKLVSIESAGVPHADRALWRGRKAVWVWGPSAMASTGGVRKSLSSSSSSSFPCSQGTDTVPTASGGRRYDQSLWRPSRVD